MIEWYAKRFPRRNAAVICLRPLSAEMFIGKKKEGRNGPSKLHLFQDYQPETVKRWRPFALLLERTLRPFLDFMRARKPCTFLRLRLLG